MEEVSWEDEFSGATPRERLCAIAFLVELLWPLVETGAHDDETELPVDAARVVLDSIWDVAAGRSQKVAGLPALSMPVMMIGTEPGHSRWTRTARVEHPEARRVLPAGRRGP